MAAAEKLARKYCYTLFLEITGMNYYRKLLAPPFTGYSWTSKVKTYLIKILGR